MGWGGMVIIGQRSSKILIRKGKKDIQRQERQKKQEKNWLTKHESYILVRDAWAGLFMVFFSLCFCICRFLFQQVRSPPSLFFCDSLFHSIPPLTLSCSLSNICRLTPSLAKESWHLSRPIWLEAWTTISGGTTTFQYFVCGEGWHKMSTVYTV